MNTIKLTLLSFKKNIFTFILIIFQLSVLFLVENYMVSVLKEREMLKVPFKAFFNENTAFIYDSDYSKNAAFLGISDSKTSRGILLSDIKDKYKIYDVLTFNNGEYTVYSINDELFGKMALPLSYGKYGNAVGTFGTPVGTNEIVLPNGTIMKLNTSGELTQTTYIPDMMKVSSQDMTINDFYYTSANERSVILTNRSSVSGYESYFSCSMGFLIEFESNSARNIEILKDKALVVPINEIADNTDKALQKDLSVFLPLVGTVLLIIVVGIVCISVLIFKDNERKNGVLWLCGFSRSKIVAVHCANILPALILSLGISFFVFLILKVIGNEFVTGISFTAANFAVTLITSVFLLGAAAIIPAIKCSRISPVEYLRRTL